MVEDIRTARLMPLTAGRVGDRNIYMVIEADIVHKENHLPPSWPIFDSMFLTLLDACKELV